MRLLALVIIAGFAAHAQSPPPAIRFEVASIRPVPPGPPDANNPSFAAFRAGKATSFCIVCVSGLRYDNYGMVLKELIADAYRIDSRLVVAPDWVNQTEGTQFVIHAVLPEGATREQIPDMLRALLEERFHLVSHRATVEQTAYALVAAKNGPKLKKPGDVDRSGCEEWSDAGGPAGSGNQVCRTGQVIGDRHINVMTMTNSVWGPMLSSTSRDSSLGTSESHGEYFRITMPELAKLLTNLLSSVRGAQGAGSIVQVTDRTGIAGAWDAVVDYEFDSKLPSASASLEKQGLRLERTTVPVEKLIIDSIDKVPTEN